MPQGRIIGQGGPPFPIEFRKEPSPPIPAWVARELRDIGGPRPDRKDRSRLEIFWGGTWSKKFFGYDIPCEIHEHWIEQQGWTIVTPYGVRTVREMDPNKWPLNLRDSKIHVPNEVKVVTGVPAFFIGEWIHPNVARVGWVEKAHGPLDAATWEGVYQRVWKIPLHHGEAGWRDAVEVAKRWQRIKDEDLISQEHPDEPASKEAIAAITSRWWQAMDEYEAEASALEEETAE